MPRNAQAVPGVQCINSGNPDPLEICAKDDSTPGVWLDQPNNPRTRQYFGDYSWASVVWLAGTDPTKLYSSENGGGAAFTPVSNAVTGAGTAADPYVVTTVNTLGATGVQFTQRFSYVNGDRSFRKTWTFVNTGSTTFNDLRFFHGGDTYFGGSDSARSWYDPGSQMVYVTNATFTNTGYMGFFPNPGTPIARYFSGAYYEGTTQAATEAQLNNTANSDFLDAGYQLQWNRATLAPGETWAIEAFEYWSPAGSLQAFAPALSYVAPGKTVTKTFRVQNLDPSNSISVDLEAVAGSLGWPVSLAPETPSSINLAALAVESVNVLVQVPANASSGDIEDVTLKATGPAPASKVATAAGRLTAYIPGYSISPTSLPFGSAPSGQTRDLTVTVSNGASALDATIGSIVTPAAPFSIANDGCSNRTLTSGQSCSVVVRFAPGGGGNFSGTLTLPMQSPVITTEQIQLSGTGTTGFEVKTSAGTGGTISPTEVTVQSGQTAAFTLASAAGYAVDTVSGCAGALSGNSYTTGAISSACTVTATFRKLQYTVSATAGKGGSISPASLTVNHGDPAQFEVTEDSGFGITSVSGCDGTLSGKTYTIAGVTSSCTVTAAFSNSPPVFEVPQPEVLNLNSSSLFTVLPTDVVPRARDLNGSETDVTLIDAPARFGPGEYTLTWRTEDSRGVQTTVTQVLRVWPTVSFGPDVTIGGTAGNYAFFRVSLNGRSPVYPLSVPYHIEGDVTGSDLQDGVVVFENGETEKDIGFAMTNSLPAGTPDQTVRVTFGDDVNLGSARPLTITITTVNRPATVRLAPLPGGSPQAVIARDAGPVTLSLDIVDPNSSDQHTVEWLAPSGASFTMNGNALVLNPGSLQPGVHRFQVTVTDNGSPPSVTRSVFDVVILPTAPVLPAGATELLPSGLPNHPDYAPPTPNVLPERERELHHFVMESQPGTELALGAYAQARATYQTELQSGGTVDNLLPADATQNVGGIFDFVIAGLPRVGDPVSIVIPQRVAIPAKPIYRKFSTATRKWQSFVEDTNNRLASAPGSSGFCPPPASDQYRPGLNVGDWCVRLTIVDGGPNDDDGQANGSVSDPGGVGSLQEVVVSGKSKGGGGAFDVLTLLAGAILLGARALRGSLARRKLRAGVLCALGAVASQATLAADSGLYAGGEFGTSRNDGDAGQLESDLRALGHEVSVTIDERSHAAWRVFGGFDWSKYVATEVGYTDLGDVRTTFTGAITDVQQLLEDANELHPTDADGFDLSVVGRYPLTDRWSVHAKAGVFAWDARTRTVEQGGLSVRRKDSGEDLLFGAGASFNIEAKWLVTGDWSRYEVGNSHVNFARVGLTYRWH